MSHQAVAIPFLNDNASVLSHILLGCAVSHYILQKPIMRHHFLEMVQSFRKLVVVHQSLEGLWTSASLFG